MLKICFGLLAIATFVLSERVDYSGHTVLSVIPKTQEDLEFLHKLRIDYGVDLWNEPRTTDTPVLIHLEPNMITPVEQALTNKNIEYAVVFDDLQSTILAEQVMNSQSKSSHADTFDFGKYNELSEIEALLKKLDEESTLATLDIVGKSYENRNIYNLVISSGNQPDKEAIMMECGIHAREWSSVAACAYLVNKLVTEYETNELVKTLVDKYEFNIIVEANPDGYVYTWTQDRLWRKTRSHSSIDWLGVCRGADANRNFDIDHCGIGTSRKPCDEIYCGDKPFSESESRTIRDLMVKLGSRLKGYFSVHAFSQLWMTPYGTSKKLPSNYNDLVQVSNAGVTALAQKYGTVYKVGSIANIIYEAAGSSVDYVYEKLGLKMAFALELRDTGRHGFFLPRSDILPMCEETFDGLMAAIQAIK